MKNLFSFLFTAVFLMVSTALADQFKAGATKDAASKEATPKAAPEAPLQFDKSNQTRVSARKKSSKKTAAPAATPAPSKVKDNSAKPLEEQIEEADKSDLDQE